MFKKDCYVWWKKCRCTSWDIQIPVNNWDLPCQHGLCGFLPSTWLRSALYFQTKLLGNQPLRMAVWSRPPPADLKVFEAKCWISMFETFLPGNPDLSMAAILMKGRWFFVPESSFRRAGWMLFAVPKKHHPYIGLKQQRKRGRETGRIKILRWDGESIVLPQTPRFFFHLYTLPIYISGYSGWFWNAQYKDPYH